MRRTCTADDEHVGDGENRCGRVFHDEIESVICPHDRLDALPPPMVVSNVMPKPDYVYVASSWENPIQIAVCASLKAAGIQHYDFKNPSPGDKGFHWSEVMDSYTGRPEQLADQDEYLEAINHPIAQAGFDSDFGAMHRADCFVLVLPCGRSAHLELGWAVGKGLRTAILLDGAMKNNMVRPELMYKMVDYLAPSLFDLLGWLGVED